MGEEKEKPDTGSPGQPDRVSKNGEGGEPTKPHEAPLPAINFSTLIISLNASALVHMGVLNDPGTGKKEKNLILAKQTIDTISMLEEKTKGNLTSEEASILKNILYDLRIIYVKETT
jgi:hypothetical protein